MNNNNISYKNSNVTNLNQYHINAPVSSPLPIYKQLQTQSQKLSNQIPTNTKTTTDNDYASHSYLTGVKILF